MKFVHDLLQWLLPHETPSLPFKSTGGVFPSVRSDYFWWKSGALLLVPCAWPSVRLLARNPVGIPHVERLLVFSMAAWLASLLLVVFLVRIGFDKRTVVLTLFVGLVAVFAGGGVIRRFGVLYGWAILAVVVLLMLFVARRRSDSSAAGVLVVVIAVALMSGPVVDGFYSLGSYGSSGVHQVVPWDLELRGGSDVYLIVLDGFPAVQTMDADFDSRLGSKLADNLRRSGFSLPAHVTAAYPATDYSVPSMLQMDYPVSEDSNSDGTLQDLYNVIAGENRLRSVLSQNGYQTVMVESGWSGSSCGSWYDKCIASSWFDDPMYQALRATAIGATVAPASAFQYAVGSKLTMGWLRENLPRLSQNHQPDFVFAHVLAPHAPFFLTEDCSIDPDESREGYFFKRPGTSDRVRSSYLEGQIKCLERFMVELGKEVENDAVMVFASDHGTDRHDQTARDPSTWSAAERDERMRAFTAAKLPAHCSLGDQLHLPNLMRRVLSCLGAPSVPDVPTKTFLFNRHWEVG